MKFTLSIRIHLGANVLDNGQLELVRKILCVQAPAWTKGLHVYEDRKRYPVDSAIPGALTDEVRRISTECGPLYHYLVERYPGGDHRVTGTAEIRGSDLSFVIYLQHDERLLPLQLSGARIFSNWVTIAVRRVKVEGIPAAQWAYTVFRAFCDKLCVLHGYATMQGEYYKKNMPTGDQELQDVTGDTSRGLCGLYWLNFFGTPYRDFIGKERLLSAPAHRVEEVDEGVLVQLDPNPKAWNTPEYKEKERAVLDHIGPEHFFLKERGYEGTVTPDLVAWLERTGRWQ